ncbi:PKD domain-containing protein [Marinoscillum pacificum]|uniref:PKD domain-containing protein n=1 Tax=Marinoscillum pacificum TaxID=392723 RepID=UPI0021578EE7|nr:PKD domain-containing protein [Marinoscillum pacificum]
MWKFFAFVFILVASLPGSGQCLDSDFGLDESVCLNENILLENATTGATSYNWDFCSGNLWQLPDSESLGVLSGSSLFDLATHHKGVHYGFYTDRTGNRLYRIELASDLSEVSQTTNFGNIGGYLSSPDKVLLYEESGQWYGLVTNDQSSDNLVRLSFGSSLGNDPTAESLGDFGGKLNRPRGIRLEQDGDSLVLLVLNRGDNTLSVVNFGSSITTIPSDESVLKSGAITDASVTLDLSLGKDCDQWYGFSVSAGNGNIHRFSFGDSLYQLPVIETFSVGLTSLSQIELGHDGVIWHGFISGNSGFYRLDFSDGLSSSPDLIDLASTGLSNLVGIDLVNDTLGFAIDNSSKALYRLDFGSGCSVSDRYSSAYEPTGVSYSESGTYYVSLAAIDSEGNRAYHLDTVTVTASLAPDIDFSIDANRCISNSNSFTSINTSNDIDTYSWDFDDDGIEDSDVQNPTYQFASSGTYTVRLEVVSSGGCTNFVEKELTIYEEPPDSSFDYTVTSECTNAEFSFHNNTIETGYDDVLYYQWVIAGDTVDQQDTTYTFTTPGEKIVSLQSFLPGCASAIFRDTLTVVDGPSVGFTYTNNCFGEAIQFTDTTIGSGITSYSWDFGDGTGLVTEQNPMHTYSLTGSYTVSLTVSNGDGCSNASSQSVVVSDASKVSFTTPATLEQNVASVFTGTDLTNSYDSIESWRWSVDGQEESIEQSPALVFTSTGSYTVELTAVSYQGCEETVSAVVSVEEPSCPTSIFSVIDQVCTGESLTVSNSSVNSASYNWDFCSGSMFGSPGATSVSTIGLSFPADLTQVYEGDTFYGFVSGRDNNSLLRLTYRDGLDASPQTTNFGNIGGYLSSPDKVLLYEESGQWYGLVTNDQSSDNLVRLSFGSSLGNDPTAESLGDFGGKLNRPRGIRLEQDGDSLVLLVLNRGDNTLSVVNFGSSITTIPSDESVLKSGAITDASVTLDLSLGKDCDQWYGFSVSAGNGNIHRFSFGDSLYQLPVIETFSVGLTSLSQIELGHDGVIWHGFISGNSGFYRLDFSDGLSSSPDLIDLASTGLSNLVGIDLVNDTLGFAIDNSSKALYRLDFGSGCSVSDRYSSAYEPTGVSYSESGTYYVSLAAIDSEGNVSYHLDTVTVSDNIAPDIDFTGDASRCVTNANTFTSINTSGDITSYAWDFNDDGIIDSTDPNPQVLFDTIAGTGTYKVRLEVESSGGCGNFVEQEITIYPEPPVPSFEFTAETFCAGSEVTLSITNDVSAFDGNLSYYWSITNLEDTITSDDLTVSFDSGGDKVISVYSFIPGCESSIFRDTIYINESPVVDFQESPTCDGDIMTFTSLSEGSSFHWDFGDGYISTEQSPNHLYSATGAYEVQLSVENDLGCTSVLTKEVVVSAIPEPEFEYDIVCQGSETILRDVSVVNGADIAQWEWYVEGRQVSTQQSPELVFESVEDQVITLTVYSSSGCSATYTESLSVLAEPDVQILADVSCYGESSILTDMSANQEEIITRMWRVNGNLLDTNEPQLDYLFDQPGTYEVSLTIDNENLCSATKTQTINVLTPPSLGFSSTNSCENENIIITDTSSVFDDAIVSRKWFVNGEQFGSGTQSVVPVESDGEIEVTLRTTTNSGCEITQSKLVSVDPKPEVAFSLSNDYGVPPFSLATSNLTENGTEYFWYINDELVSSAAEPSLSFTETGRNEVKLVTVNEFGCVDSTSQIIRSIQPIVDLSIRDLQLVGSNKVGFTLANNSNIPVDSIEFQIILEDLFDQPEVVVQRINDGEEKQIILSTSLPLKLDYFCIRMTTPYNVEDQNTLDNEVCMNINEDVIFEPPYPNPTNSTSIIRAVLPRSGDVSITILDLSGQIQQNLLLENQPAGLTSVIVDMTIMDAGAYFIVIDYEGASYKSRVIKQ